MALQRGSKIYLHIDRLSVGGRGVGRAEKLVVFVSDVCAGEDVEVEITFLKKNFAEARLLTILKPSSARVTPACPVAGLCGGCNWQHVDYPTQLATKRELVRESLRKFSGFDVSRDDSVQPVTASPKSLRYRNRVQFHYDHGELGYFRRGSHKLISVSDCPIAEEPIAAKIPELRERFEDTTGRIEVFIAEDERVQVRSGTEDEDEGGLSFAFAQVNTQQNRNLISMVVSQFITRLLDSERPVIFDLYAGSGNFTFPLRKAFPQAKITAVELNRESVARGRDRGQDIRWAEGDVGAFVARENLEGAVLLDPPRAGCDPAVVHAIAASEAAFVVYVSCHPVTLARDLKVFKEAGWTLELVQPLDMFPQTDHVETLAVLTRPTSVGA